LKLKRSWLLWQRTGKQKWKGFYTYTALAKEETDPHRRNVLRGLAIAEKHHADLWAGRIRELGGSEPEYTGDLSGQADSLANRIGGADLALRRLEIDEGRDIAKYGKQLKVLGDQSSVAILQEVIADEREHYQTLGTLIRSRVVFHPYPLSRFRQRSMIWLQRVRRDIRTQQTG
jgi:rubrerythrin